jgi:hypothetical protein
MSNDTEAAPTRAKATPLDDIIVTAFAFLGFAGALFLPLKYRIPPIMLAILAATGIAALTYRFLGGVSGTSLQVGALKATGALAALLGVAIVVNNYLVRQVPFQLVSDDDVVGAWKWVYARGATAGHLYFSKDANGKLAFSGDQGIWKSENGPVIPLYMVTNGTARIRNHNLLEMEADVEDQVYKAKMHWRAITPLELRPSFRGSMRATREDGSVITDTWGIAFYKLAPGED